MNDRERRIKAILRTENIQRTAEKLYEKKFAIQLIRYFDRPAFRIEGKTEFDRAGNPKGERTTRVAEDYPTLYGYLSDLGITREIFDIWVRTHVEFARAFDMARQCQFNILLTNALRGDYNATIAKLELIATHGVSEDRVAEPLEIKLTVV